MGNFEIRGFEDTYLLETVAENYKQAHSNNCMAYIKKPQFYLY